MCCVRSFLLQVTEYNHSISYFWLASSCLAMSLMIGSQHIIFIQTYCKVGEIERSRGPGALIREYELSPVIFLDESSRFQVPLWWQLLEWWFSPNSATQTSTQWVNSVLKWVNSFSDRRLHFCGYGKSVGLEATAQVWIFVDNL